MANGVLFVVKEFSLIEVSRINHSFMSSPCLNTGVTLRSYFGHYFLSFRIFSLLIKFYSLTLQEKSSGNFSLPLFSFRSAVSKAIKKRIKKKKKKKNRKGRKRGEKRKLKKKRNENKLDA